MVTLEIGPRSALTMIAEVCPEPLMCCGKISALPPVRELDAVHGACRRLRVPSRQILLYWMTLRPGACLGRCRPPGR